MPITTKMATIWVSERPVERVHFSLTLYGASGDLCRRYRQHSVSAIDELTSTGERAHRSAFFSPLEFLRNELPVPYVNRPIRLRSTRNIIGRMNQQSPWLECDLKGSHVTFHRLHSAFYYLASYLPYIQVKYFKY